MCAFVKQEKSLQKYRTCLQKWGESHCEEKDVDAFQKVIRGEKVVSEVGTHWLTSGLYSNL
jgi:hypothetical protein